VTPWRFPTPGSWPSSGVAKLPPVSYVGGMSITQTPLPGPDAAAIGIAALVVVYAKDLWSLAQHFPVMAHEGMHAITGAMLGFRVKTVELYQNGNGQTTYYNQLLGGGAVFTGFVGYLGPSAFGLAAAGLIHLGYIIAVLWLAVTFLWVLLLALLRSFRYARTFGYLSVPVTMALFFVLIYYGSVTLQIVLAYGITWVLLLSGFRIAVQHWTRAGDAGILKDQTHLPRWFWAVLWVGGTFSALCLGWRLLVARA
jgi:peptidase M50B-like protein